MRPTALSPSSTPREPITRSSSPNTPPFTAGNISTAASTNFSTNTAGMDSMYEGFLDGPPAFVTVPRTSRRWMLDHGTPAVASVEPQGLVTAIAVYLPSLESLIRSYKDAPTPPLLNAIVPIDAFTPGGASAPVVPDDMNSFLAGSDPERIARVAGLLGVEYLTAYAFGHLSEWEEEEDAYVPVARNLLDDIDAATEDGETPRTTPSGETPAPATAASQATSSSLATECSSASSEPPGLLFVFFQRRSGPAGASAVTTASCSIQTGETGNVRFTARVSRVGLDVDALHFGDCVANESKERASRSMRELSIRNLSPLPGGFSSASPSVEFSLHLVQQDEPLKEGDVDGCQLSIYSYDDMSELPMDRAIRLGQGQQRLLVGLDFSRYTRSASSSGTILRKWTLEVSNSLDSSNIVRLPISAAFVFNVPAPVGAAPAPSTTNVLGLSLSLSSNSSQLNLISAAQPVTPGGSLVALSALTSPTPTPNPSTISLTSTPMPQPMGEFEIWALDRLDIVGGPPRQLVPGSSLVSFGDVYAGETSSRVFRLSLKPNANATNRALELKLALDTASSSAYRDHVTFRTLATTEIASFQSISQTPVSNLVSESARITPSSSITSLNPGDDPADEGAAIPNVSAATFADEDGTLSNASRTRRLDSTSTAANVAETPRFVSSAAGTDAEEGTGEAPASAAEGESAMDGAAGNAHNAMRSRSNTTMTTGGINSSSNAFPNPAALGVSRRTSFAAVAFPEDASSETTQQQQLQTGQTLVRLTDAHPTCDIVVTYRSTLPAGDLHALEESLLRLTKKSWRLICSVSSNVSSPAPAFTRTIWCEARTCVSLVAVTPSEIRFGDCVVGEISTSSLLTLSNKSEVRAHMFLRTNSSNIMLNDSGESSVTLTLEPKATTKINVSILPMKVDPNYLREIAVINTRCGENSTTVTVQSSNVDPHNVSYHSLFYKMGVVQQTQQQPQIAAGGSAFQTERVLDEELPVTELTFGPTQLNSVDPRRLRFTNLTDHELVVRLHHESAAGDEFDVFKFHRAGVSSEENDAAMRALLTPFEVARESEGRKGPSTTTPPLARVDAAEERHRRWDAAVASGELKPSGGKHTLITLGPRARVVVIAVFMPRHSSNSTSEPKLETVQMTLVVNLASLSESHLASLTEATRFAHWLSENQLSAIAKGLVPAREIPVRCSKAVNSKIALVQSHFSFGKITYAWERKQANLTIRNLGALPLLYRIEQSSSKVSGIEFSASATRGVVSPFGSKTVEFTYAPSVWRGKVEETLNVVNVLDPLNSTCSFIVKADVAIPEYFILESDTPILDFGLCVPGHTSVARQGIALVNTTEKPREFVVQVAKDAGDAWPRGFVAVFNFYVWDTAPAKQHAIMSKKSSDSSGIDKGSSVTNSGMEASMGEVEALERSLQVALRKGDLNKIASIRRKLEVAIAEAAVYVKSLAKPTNQIQLPQSHMGGPLQGSINVWVPAQSRVRIAMWLHASRLAQIGDDRSVFSGPAKHAGLRVYEKKQGDHVVRWIPFICDFSSAGNDYWRFGGASGHRAHRMPTHHAYSSPSVGPNSGLARVPPTTASYHSDQSTSPPASPVGPVSLFPQRRNRSASVANSLPITTQRLNRASSEALGTISELPHASLDGDNSAMSPSTTRSQRMSMLKIEPERLDFGEIIVPCPLNPGDDADAESKRNIAFYPARVVKKVSLLITNSENEPILVSARTNTNQVIVTHGGSLNDSTGFAVDRVLVNAGSTLGIHVAVRPYMPANSWRGICRNLVGAVVVTGENGRNNTKAAELLVPMFGVIGMSVVSASQQNVHFPGTFRLLNLSERLSRVRVALHSLGPVSRNIELAPAKTTIPKRGNSAVRGTKSGSISEGAEDDLGLPVGQMDKPTTPEDDAPAHEDDDAAPAIESDVRKSSSDEEKETIRFVPGANIDTLSRTTDVTLMIEAKPNTRRNPLSSDKSGLLYREIRAVNLDSLDEERFVVAIIPSVPSSRYESSVLRIERGFGVRVVVPLVDGVFAAREAIAGEAVRVRNVSHRALRVLVKCGYHPTPKTARTASTTPDWSTIEPPGVVGVGDDLRRSIAVASAHDAQNSTRDATRIAEAERPLWDLVTRAEVVLQPGAATDMFVRFEAGTELRRGGFEGWLAFATALPEDLSDLEKRIATSSDPTKTITTSTKPQVDESNLVYSVRAAVRFRGEALESRFSCDRLTYDAGDVGYGSDFTAVRVELARVCSETAILPAEVNVSVNGVPPMLKFRPITSVLSLGVGSPPGEWRSVWVLIGCDPEVQKGEAGPAGASQDYVVNLELVNALSPKENAFTIPIKVRLRTAAFHIKRPDGQYVFQTKDAVLELPEIVMQPNEPTVVNTWVSIVNTSSEKPLILMIRFLPTDDVVDYTGEIECAIVHRATGVPCLGGILEIGPSETKEVRFVVTAKPGCAARDDRVWWGDILFSEDKVIGNPNLAIDSAEATANLPVRKRSQMRGEMAVKRFSLVGKATGGPVVRLAPNAELDELAEGSKGIRLVNDSACRHARVVRSEVRFVSAPAANQEPLPEIPGGLIVEPRSSSFVTLQAPPGTCVSYALEVELYHTVPDAPLRRSQAGPEGYNRVLGPTLTKVEATVVGPAIVPPIATSIDVLSSVASAPTNASATTPLGDVSASSAANNPNAAQEDGSVLTQLSEAAPSAANSNAVVLKGCTFVSAPGLYQIDAGVISDTSTWIVEAVAPHTLVNRRVVVVRGDPDGRWLSISRCATEANGANGALEIKLSPSDRAHFGFFSGYIVIEGCGVIRVKMELVIADMTLEGFPAVDPMEPQPEEARPLSSLRRASSASHHPSSLGNEHFVVSPAVGDLGMLRFGRTRRVPFTIRNRDKRSELVFQLQISGGSDRRVRTWTTLRSHPLEEHRRVTVPADAAVEMFAWIQCVDDGEGSDVASEGGRVQVNVACRHVRDSRATAIFKFSGIHRPGFCAQLRPAGPEHPNESIIDVELLRVSQVLMVGPAWIDVTEDGEDGGGERGASSRFGLVRARSKGDGESHARFRVRGGPGRITIYDAKDPSDWEELYHTRSVTSLSRSMHAADRVASLQRDDIELELVRVALQAGDRVSLGLVARELLDLVAKDPGGRTGALCKLWDLTAALHDPEIAAEYQGEMEAAVALWSYPREAQPEGEAWASDAEWV